MDAKLKWWNKELAKEDDGAKEKDKSTVAASRNATDDDIVEEVEDAVGAEDLAAVAVVQPGAVAVRGPEYQGSGFDDTSTVPGGGGNVNGNDNTGDDEAPPLHVDSYLVREGMTDEEIRRRILAGTAHAEELDKVESTESRRLRQRRRNAALALLAVVVVAAAIGTGVAVPLSKPQTSGPTSQPRDENVVASLRYLEYQGSGGLATAVLAETRKSSSDGSLVTSGSLEIIICNPKVCMENDTNCMGGGGNNAYVPGCCVGPDCPKETACAENCPAPPESCYLTDPDNQTCMSSSCYTCPKVNGEDVYVLFDFAVSVDCLEVGTAIRPDNGLEYKWAIFCGPTILGPIVEENRDLGEYQCGAIRTGANYSDDEGGGGVLGAMIPCQFIALGECGCGPSDMYTFGLPAPTGLCQPDSGCPFLCEGVGGGNEYARNVCRSFPGNISWWDGKNAFNGSWFSTNVQSAEFELEIYIKGVVD